MTGFDRAQAAYDNATPEYLEDEDDREADEYGCYCSDCRPAWCDECGDQAVCPECKGT